MASLLTTRNDASDNPPMRGIPMAPAVWRKQSPCHTRRPFDVRSITRHALNARSGSNVRAPPPRTVRYHEGSRRSSPSRLLPPLLIQRRDTCTVGTPHTAKLRRGHRDNTTNGLPGRYPGRRSSRGSGHSSTGAAARSRPGEEYRTPTDQTVPSSAGSLRSTARSQSATEAAPTTSPLHTNMLPAIARS